MKLIDEIIAVEGCGPALKALAPALGYDAYLGRWLMIGDHLRTTHITEDFALTHIFGVVGRIIDELPMGEEPVKWSDGWWSRRHDTIKSIYETIRYPSYKAFCLHHKEKQQ